MHTHVAWDICMNNLEESMLILDGAGYDGYWGVEHHTGKDEHPEVAIQIEKVKEVLLRWQESSGKGGA